MCAHACVRACVCRGVNRCLLSTLSAVPLSAQCFGFTDFSGKSVLAFHMKCGQEARSQSVTRGEEATDAEESRRHQHVQAASHCMATEGLILDHCLRIISFCSIHQLGGWGGGGSRMTNYTT